MTTALADARRGHRGLFAFAVAMAALTPVLAILVLVDDRVLLGAPLWLKPLKFAVSLALYSATLSWMLGQLRERALSRTGWIITVAGGVEMAIIVGQAAVGNRSHYNMDTPLSAALWGTMGVTITVLWLATLAVAVRFLRVPGRDRAAGTAIRLGVVVALIGLGEGFLMASTGAHAVGVPDGGPGLPLVGWSTTGGDLRVAHFIGMHALQGLPLLAFALAATRLGEDTRVRLVRIAAAAWTGLVVLLTWQALRAQPLLAPDAVTLAALATLVAVTAAATVGTLAPARRTTAPTTV
ncbi:MAG: hypothetical protein JNM77_05620 [Pseudonocardia sp.]|nr:hypothetical protein [Pseudonocardia sp.]